MNIDGFRLVGAGLLAWISKAITFALSCAQEASSPARGGTVQKGEVRFSKIELRGFIPKNVLTEKAALKVIRK